MEQCEVDKSLRILFFRTGDPIILFLNVRGNFNEDAIKRERRADGKDSAVSKENLNEREQ